jgi:PAS domain-containing protein
MIQATDMANQRTLERQIATFSDALDLMVDQRVAQLTAGNASLGRLLDDAGVVVVSFDEGGSTRRWSRAAEELTGRRAPHVPHFTAFTSVLGFPPPTREAFSAWFWGPSEGAFAAEVFAADGPPRRILWRKALSAEGGRAERRALVGVEMGRAAAPTATPAGDGMGGAFVGYGAFEPVPNG